jgi:hypothetical protein
MVTTEGVSRAMGVTAAACQVSRVDESRIGKVGAFAVNSGNLTELPSSPTALPAGATPAGIVVN